MARRKPDKAGEEGKPITGDLSAKMLEVYRRHGPRPVGSWCRPGKDRAGPAEPFRDARRDVVRGRCGESCSGCRNWTTR